jgi:hypothetical protein
VSSSLEPKLPRTLLGLEGEFSGPFDLQTKAIRYFENSADTSQRIITSQNTAVKTLSLTTSFPTILPVLVTQCRSVRALG